ncbi:helix-turn-helix domain-containing protein [Brevundimonas balnearis]|uniref:Helix-turn-helix domain-containing protein n=1 Tax=Brevundimonas balnearis TaxID=1572858 RepID=A0ABV6R4Z1_9CAUL
MQAQERDVPHLSPLDDRWLPPAEAAKYLGVEVGTLSKWRLRGKGPAYSVGLGRDPRYQLSELLTYMASKMAANTREARTIRKEHKAFEGMPYTMRRQTRPTRQARRA